MTHEVRVAAVRIPVRELERSVRFYTERLGLRQGREDAGVCVLDPVRRLGPVLELVEADEIPPLHFPLQGGHFQPIIRLHASDLGGMHRRLAGISATPIHWELPHDGCGRFFEAADPDGTWLQYHVNEGQEPAMAGTTETVLNLEIPVSDVRRSAAFYEKAGFHLDREPSDDVAFLSVGPLSDWLGYGQIREFGIILSCRGEFSPMRFIRGGALEPVIELQADDASAYRSRLKDAGIAVSDWRVGGGTVGMSVSDPDGHMIGIVESDTVERAAYEKAAHSSLTREEIVQ